VIALVVCAIVVWVLWATQAVLSIFLTGRFSRSVKVSRIKNPQFTPEAVVIVPFKGVDLKLEKALESLASQDYPNYRLVFVVESGEDPVYGVLKGFAEGKKSRPVSSVPSPGSQERKELPFVTILVAGRAGPTQGQKVHNQLCALEGLWEASRDEEVWVFADSDAVPGKSWLWHMVDPLAYIGKTGMTTGYRWLIPEAGASGKATVWSHLASCMNSSCAVWLGKDEFNFAWGGSMAIRAQLARKGDLRGMLRGALCDDYQFSRLVVGQGQRIYFVPKALSASSVDFSFATLSNFAHRQYLLTRVYVPHIYLFAMLTLGFYALGFVSAWVGVVIGIVVGNWLVVAAALSAIVVVHGCNYARSRMRRLAIIALLGQETADRLEPTLVYDRWLTWVWMLLHFGLAASALSGRTMTWRGITYRLYGPQKVERVEGKGLGSKV
jgi:ceramide glucosyltransferase